MYEYIIRTCDRSDLKMLKPRISRAVERRVSNNTLAQIPPRWRLYSSRWVFIFFLSLNPPPDRQKKKPVGEWATNGGKKLKKKKLLQGFSFSEFSKRRARAVGRREPKRLDSEGDLFSNQYDERVRATVAHAQSGFLDVARAPNELYYILYIILIIL